MFGFLFGAACLGGLAALLFRRNHHHHGTCGHGHGGRFHRGRHFLYAAFERLDTTPGQEKAVTAAIDEFTYGLADRGASIRIPHSFINNGHRGYLEDRRPNSLGDPYRIAGRILQTIEEVPTEAAASAFREPERAVA